MNRPIGIIVLAAGASSRMGEPKQLLRYEGETLLGRAVGGALESSCRPVIAVLGSRAAELREQAEREQVHVAINPDWAEGMGSSIRCGIRALESLTGSAAEAAVLMLCDQPFVTASVIERLVAAYRLEGPPLIASEYVSQGRVVRGVPALFRRDLFEELSSLGGAEGAKSVIRRHESEAAIVPAQEGSFDVDTPEDYDRLRNE